MTPDLSQTCAAVERLAGADNTHAGQSGEKED